MNEKTLAILLEVINLLAFAFFLMFGVVGAAFGESTSTIDYVPLILLPVLIGLTIAILLFKNNKNSFVIFSILSAANILLISLLITIF